MKALSNLTGNIWIFDHLGYWLWIAQLCYLITKSSHSRTNHTNLYKRDKFLASFLHTYDFTCMYCAHYLRGGRGGGYVQPFSRHALFSERISQIESCHKARCHVILSKICKMWKSNNQTGLVRRSQKKNNKQTKKTWLCEVHTKWGGFWWSSKTLKMFRQFLWSSHATSKFTFCVNLIVS